MSEIPPPTVPPATPPPPGGGSYTPPPPPSGGGSFTPPPSAGGSDRTLMIVLSYLWILALIPLLTKKDDSEVQWHAKNGLALTVAEIIFYVLVSILGAVFSNSITGCGIMSAIWCALPLAFIAIRVVAIIKANAGERLRMPVVSDVADKINF